jgi:hypothetical protein
MFFWLRLATMRGRMVSANTRISLQARLSAPCTTSGPNLRKPRRFSRTEAAETLIPRRIAPPWPLPPLRPPVLTLFPSASLCLLRNKILDLLELKDFAFCAFQPTHAPSRLSFSPSKPGPLGQLLCGEDSFGCGLALSGRMVSRANLRKPRRFSRTEAAETLIARRIAPPWPLPPLCPPVFDFVFLRVSASPKKQNPRFVGTKGLRFLRLPTHARSLKTQFLPLQTGRARIDALW